MAGRAYSRTQWKDKFEDTYQNSEATENFMMDIQRARWFGKREIEGVRGKWQKSKLKK